MATGKIQSGEVEAYKAFWGSDVELAQSHFWHILSIKQETRQAHFQGVEK